MLLVVNPAWRNLAKELKKALQKVRKFAALLGMHKKFWEDRRGGLIFYIYLSHTRMIPAKKLTLIKYELAGLSEAVFWTYDLSPGNS